MDIENRLVKKSNRLISSRIKGYSLTQSKIFNLAIAELTEQTKESDVLSFQAVDLLSAIGLGKNNHSELQKATLDMIRGVEIPEEDGSFSQVPTFKKFKYHKGGGVDIQFGADILPHLIQAKTEYTKYYFQNIQRLKSNYSVKIYELCKQYQNTKQGYRDLSIDELKIYLDIPLKKYPRYCDFNSRVIKSSINEINEKTDLKVDIEPIKKGRTTTGIRFFITPKNREQAQEQEQPTLPHDFKELTPAGQQLVNDYLMSPEMAVEIQVLAPSDEHLFYAMKILNKKIDLKLEKGGSIGNMSAYVRSALEESIPIIISSNIVEKEQRKKEENKKKLEVKQKEEEQKKTNDESKKSLEADFKVFCHRGDLLDVLKEINLQNTLAIELPEENVFLIKQANKESGDFFAKDIKSLNSQDVFQILTDSVEGFTFPATATVKPSKYRNLKNYLKVALKTHF